MLKDAWTLAIETLSWIEMQKLSERMALAKTVRQLGIRDPDAIRLAYGLVLETERRRNLIDKFVNSQLRGKVVFLNFWAPWCIPCREELPALEVLQRKYLREGLVIIAISLDKSESNVTAFLRNVPVTFPVLVDKNADASDAYCVSGLPTGFLIDRNGIIRFKHRGFGKEYVSMYEKEFIELLHEQ